MAGATAGGGRGGGGSGGGTAAVVVTLLLALAALRDTAEAFTRIPALPHQMQGKAAVPMHVYKQPVRPPTLALTNRSADRLILI